MKKPSETGRFPPLSPLSEMSSAPNNFYTVGGTLRSDSRCYVERQADRDLHAGLAQGEFCYVLTSRQMGKSSLMVRTAARLRQEGCLVAVLDLTAIGQNLSPGQWYEGLTLSLGRQTRLEDELEEFGREHARLSPVQRFITGLRQIVLEREDRPVVIFIDEIDNVRSLPFSTDEFFAAIRECYNRRTEDAAFQRLTFCLLGVAAPTDLIRDTRITPFNIGCRIELNDFTAGESFPLASGLGCDDGTAGRVLDRILHWTHGHPYLTQRLCRAVAADAQARSPGEVDRICDELFLSSRASERDDNLLFVRDRLLRSEGNRADLLSLYDAVRRGRPVADDETSPLVTTLRLAGIVRAEQGKLRVRNRIYEHVFDRHWVRTHMPEQELRRQREAFRRGLARGGLLAAAVVLLAILGNRLVRERLEAARIEAAKERIGAAYHPLQSYADALDLKEDTQYEGGARDVDSVLVQLRAEKPNKLYLEARIIRFGAVNELTITSDGRTLLVLRDTDQTYVTNRAGGSFGELFDQIASILPPQFRELNLGLPDTIYPLILANDPVEAFRERRIGEIQFVREAEFGGTPAYVFRWDESIHLPFQTNRPSISVTNWIARDGRILQIEKDITGLEQGPGRFGRPVFGRGGRGGVLATNQQTLLTMRHSAIRLNPPLRESDFLPPPLTNATPVLRFSGRGFGGGGRGRGGPGAEPFPGPPRPPGEFVP